jgi:hypothetical protein
LSVVLGTSLSFAVAGNSPLGVAVGDFNGDGRPDLVTADAATNSVRVLLNNGAGGFGEAVSFNAGAAPGPVAVADFNGDGRADLVVTKFSTNSVTVLLGNGAGGFGSPHSFAVGTGPRSVAVGDFDLDGHPDLAVADFNGDGAADTLTLDSAFGGLIVVRDGIRFDGGSGSGNTLTLLGTAGTDTFSLTPTSATLDRSQVVTFTNVQIATAVGDGNDLAFLTGSSGADTLTASPTAATLTGPGFSLTATAFAAVTAFGGPGDLAFLAGGPGGATLVGTPTYVTSSGPGFRTTASGFAQVTARAGSGGHDTADLYEECLANGRKSRCAEFFPWTWSAQALDVAWRSSEGLFGTGWNVLLIYRFALASVRESINLTETTGP